MAVLGLRGTGSFSASERPQNWREGILFDSPNGDAPLTAILSKLRSEKTDDARFNWFEKETPLQRVFIDNGAGYAAGATTFVIDDSLGGDPGVQLVIGTVLYLEDTDEVVFVTADQTVGTSVDVARGKGETAAAAIVDNAPILVIGSVHEEGAGLPTAVTFNPTVPFNYTQIYRNPLNLTRTALKTRLRTQEAIREAKREALQQHSIQMERSYIYGQRLEETGPNGQLRRTTRGVIKWLPTTNNVDLGGGVTESEFEGHLETLFRFGSSEKLALVGSTALSVINQLAKNKGTMNIVPRGEVYGMHMVEFVSPFGVLFMKQHPLFNQHAVHWSQMLCIDLANLVYRWLDDTTFLINRQARGDDARKDEFLTEAGLELQFPKHHMLMTNMTSFTP